MNYVLFVQYDIINTKVKIYICMCNAHLYVNVSQTGGLVKTCFIMILYCFNCELFITLLTKLYDCGLGM